MSCLVSPTIQKTPTASCSPLCIGRDGFGKGFLKYFEKKLVAMGMGYLSIYAVVWYAMSAVQ